MKRPLLWEVRHDPETHVVDIVLNETGQVLASADCHESVRAFEAPVAAGDFEVIAHTEFIARREAAEVLRQAAREIYPG